MSGLPVHREELDRLTHSPMRFDALVAEDDQGATFEKTVTMDDPGVAEQRVTSRVGPSGRGLAPVRAPGTLVRPCARI